MSTILGECQSNSSDAGVLVRYITRTDRKTAHVYARVIESAVSNEISEDQFCGYIQERGGIEQIRSIGVDPTVSAKKEKLEKDGWDLALQYCQAREELPFAYFELKSDLDYGQDRRVAYEYFACAKRNGRHFVLAKIPADEAFEDRAINLLGTYFSSDLESAKDQVIKLVEKSKLARKKRIAKETPGLAKILDVRDQEQKSLVQE